MMDVMVVTDRANDSRQPALAGLDNEEARGWLHIEPHDEETHLPAHVEPGHSGHGDAHASHRHEEGHSAETPGHEP